MDVSKSKEWRQYLEQNGNSRRHAEKVGKIVPSGSSRSLLRHPPFPFFVESAAGISSVDLDGNERLDFHNNYTTLIHGHGHPEIIAAVELGNLRRIVTVMGKSVVAGAELLTTDREDLALSGNHE